MVVVDTPVLAGLWFETDQLRWILELMKRDSDWVAPASWRPEFRNLVSELARIRAIGWDDALEAIKFAEELMKGATLDVPAATVMELVKNSSCRAGACEFAGLATELDAPLVTMNEEILNAFPVLAITPENFCTQSSR